MNSLLNPQRPPVFCPGCSHDQVIKALDQALTQMGLAGHQVAIVTDIGCSGLFDTFFNTHAFHGLHGRALTYAIGIKMASPETTVIVTMGDGGLGIGGAHLLGACRRNLDITLLVLNNFNYGMTGGQCSTTTPTDAQVASGFLNQIETPVDVCRIAAAAGASYTARSTAYRKGLVQDIQDAIRHNGFALMDIWGACPGRYTKRNKISTKSLEADIGSLSVADGPVPCNQRPEYGQAYRETAARQPLPPPPTAIAPRFSPPQAGRQEVLILGSAGQRIVTAGELLCLAGITAGLHATLKNDYPITVLRGHSVSEVVLAEEPIDFSGIDLPQVILVLAPEGLARKKDLFPQLAPETLVISDAGISLPNTAAQVVTVDFKAAGLRPPDWALGALGMLAKRERVLSRPMLEAALEQRYKGNVLEASLEVLQKVGDV